MGIGILIIAIPFLVFSIILSKGKGAWLLTGYNTMSDSEKAEYDEVALCKCMGKVMYGITSSILLIALAELLDQQYLLIIGIVLFTALLIFAFVFTNTKDRFKKK